MKQIKLMVLVLWLPIVLNAQENPKNKLIQLEIRKYTQGELMQQIEKQTGHTFGYGNISFDRAETIDINRSSISLKELVRKLFPEKDYQISWRNNKILIKSKTKTFSSNQTVQVYGYITDQSSGERLVGATIFDESTMLGASTNGYGFYSVNFPIGQTVVQVRYLGYKNLALKLHLKSDTLLNLSLAIQKQYLEEVVVTDDPGIQKIQSTENGTISLSMQKLNKMPAFAGEPDVIKTIQALPGVQTIAEGTSGYFVRGGNLDQNLILLDEAPIYNPSHILGFFSIFNQDAVKDMKFFKGHIPAKYGGRLSSLLSVRMKEGNVKKFTASGGIGLVASRLTLEAPIVKDKGSIILSGRRTYADFIWQTLSADDATKNTSVYFYDFNAKANYRLNDRNTLFISGFFGRDVNKIKVQQYAIIWGNQTGTLRWNHIFNDRLFANTSLIYSQYAYQLGLRTVDNNLKWKSLIRDYSFKVDFDYFLNSSNTLTFGVHSTFHKLNPGKTNEAPELSLSNANTLEHALYIGNETKINDRFQIEYGLRASLFQNLGPSTIYQFNEAQQVIDSGSHKGVFHNFFSIEPRIAINYQLKENTSLKASYNRTAQYLHLVSNTMLPFTTFDHWMMSNPNIEPQYADQYSVGYYRRFPDRGFNLSLDAYYKHLNNQLEVVDHAQLLMNKYIEAELRSGKGYAYGFELLAEKNVGKLQGHIGYTYAKTTRKIEGINQDATYNAPFDKPHKVDFAMIYEMNKRLTFGANWVYSSGGAITAPVETFTHQGRTVPVYGDRNNARLPDFHRLDLSMSLFRRKPNAKNQSYWVFTLYNAYGRENAAGVFTSQELDSEGVKVKDPSIQKTYKSWLFSVVPAVSYNFKF
ncbi:TonB-dependent receptor [Fulvivirgaceae bacterium BMA10]|uniref:TonB-dependent receptor n=1 Tax=Splendidivirga corallicola TaxID=3051826 RepID=A0ABT8KXU3_9BACT|nr:TonB-dependent receptor [Fulvivirgaceae bacterium BMA10]